MPAVVTLLLVGSCAPPPKTIAAVTPLSSASSEASSEPSATPTDEASASSTATPTARVPLLQITSAVFHAGEVGIAYAAVTLVATGGAPPLTWSISAGTLPGGVNASTGGTVSGTPTAAGTFAFTVRVDDSAGHSATVNRSIGVAVRLNVSQPCAQLCTIGAGCSRCGGFGGVAGGIGPYVFRVTSGAIPPGMALSGLSLAGPFPAGAFSLSVTVTDALGATATDPANWSIYGPAKLVAGGPCTASANPPYCSAVRWAYSGGSPTADPKVVILGYAPYCLTTCYPTPAAPPPGWSAIAKGGVISISAGGIACNAPSYIGYVVLALVDTASCPTTSQSNSADLLVNLQNNC